MSNELIPFAERLPAVIERGYDESTWLALKQSIYAGAKDESILMVLDYCKARGLDPLMKPVHIVPMYIKAENGKGGTMRDVVMCGINTYRIQASRSGDLAGTASPKFGPNLTDNLGGQDFTYPEWCEVTVTKLINGRLVDFTAREYFLENYATRGKDSAAPNAMWAKRPRGQLAKCAEAQALRKGWPEIGQEPTYEEMAGKHLEPEPSKKHSIIAEAAEVETVIDAETADQMAQRIEAAKTIEDVNRLYSEAMELCKTANNRQLAKDFIELCKTQRGMIENVG